MEALGAAAYSTATYVFVVEVFPTNVGRVLGFMETFVGLGMSTGPAIGGLLYSVSYFFILLQVCKDYIKYNHRNTSIHSLGSKLIRARRIF